MAKTLGFYYRYGTPERHLITSVDMAYPVRQKYPARSIGISVAGDSGYMVFLQPLLLYRLLDMVRTNTGADGNRHKSSAHERVGYTINYLFLFSFIVPVIVPLLVTALQKQKRGIPDLIAGTLVVHAGEGRG